LYKTCRLQVLNKNEKYEEKKMQAMNNFSSTISLESKPKGRGEGVGTVRSGNI
jgi:hypothetical protein